MRFILQHVSLPPSDSSLTSRSSLERRHVTSHPADEKQKAHLELIRREKTEEEKRRKNKKRGEEHRKVGSRNVKEERRTTKEKEELRKQREGKKVIYGLM